MIRHNIFNLLVTDRKAAYAKHFRLLLPFIIGMGTVSYFLLQIKPTGLFFLSLHFPFFHPSHSPLHLLLSSSPTPPQKNQRPSPVTSPTPPPSPSPRLSLIPLSSCLSPSEFYWLRQLNEAKLNGDHQAVEELLAHPKFGPHHH